VLLAKRSPERTLFPGLYEGCGGQLALSETFEEGVVRHYRKELGIEVRVLLEYHCFYEIREPNEPLIPGIRFLCERMSDREPKSPNHSEFVWATEAQIKNMPSDLFVGNMKNEALDLIGQYKKKL
jgi:isopentenyldiphosphate isomerase